MDHDRGWVDVLKRVRSETSDDHLSIIAAGVAFYGMLALFPALASIVSIWALFADPADVQSLIDSAFGVLPADAATLLREQVAGIVSAAEGSLGTAAIVGILLALYGATKGTRALMTALNVVYEEDERRGFVRLTATSLALTLLGVVLAVVSFALVAVAPAAFDLVGLGRVAELVVAVGRWPTLALVMAFYLAVLYRLGPSRDRARWRWVSPGAAVATVLWLIASALFSMYVGQFGSYNEIYGALAAVVVLLSWLFLTAYVVLLGAELDAELEQRIG